MTHRDGFPRLSARSAWRSDAGHRQGFPTPSPIRPLPVRPRDRNGGFPRLSDGPWLSDGAHGLRCLASPHHALLAESLGKPSLWVITKDLWYNTKERPGPRLPGLRRPRSCGMVRAAPPRGTETDP